MDITRSIRKHKVFKSRDEDTEEGLGKVDEDDVETSQMVEDEEDDVELSEMVEDEEDDVETSEVVSSDLLLLSLA